MTATATNGNGQQTKKRTKDTLADLAHEINSNEKAAGEHILNHARTQGDLLIKARAACGKRKFAPWWKKHTTVCEWTVYAYIKIAENWDRVIPLLTKGITLTAALKYLKELEHEGEKGGADTDDEETEETGNSDNGNDAGESGNEGDKKGGGKKNGTADSSPGAKDYPVVRLEAKEIDPWWARFDKIVRRFGVRPNPNYTHLKAGIDAMMNQLDPDGREVADASAA